MNPVQRAGFVSKTIRYRAKASGFCGTGGILVRRGDTVAHTIAISKGTWSKSFQITAIATLVLADSDISASIQRSLDSIASNLPRFREAMYPGSELPEAEVKVLIDRVFLEADRWFEEFSSEGKIRDFLVGFGDRVAYPEIVNVSCYDYFDLPRPTIIPAAWL